MTALQTAEVPAVPTDDTILTVRGIDVSYGPVQVLFNVDVDIKQGEIVALLGTNGAGKSTLLKAISGLVKPSKGTIEFEGRSIAGMPANQTAALGLVQMPGGKGVFPTLTVEDNLRLAGWLVRDDKAKYRAALEHVLDMFPILRDRFDQMAGNLSGGEQQMLTMGQALLNQPKILMIDELSLGLAPAIVGQLIDVVHRIHAEGTTIIVVEQSINVALTLAERAIFMEKGEVRFEGRTQDLLERPDILRSVFIAGASTGPDETSPAAREAEQAPAVVERRPAPGPDAEVVLETRDVVKRFGGITAVDNVSLQLREGEILGLIGQNGAGKTTLFDCISGFLPIDGGQILLKGYDITDWEPHERARSRLGRSFQEARLYPSLTVAETVAVSLERHLANRDIAASALGLPASYESELAAWARVEELIGLMGLGAFRDKLVGELSTGSRRIVELACILAQDPAVLLLDEPSGGVAQRETEALGPLLQRVQEYTGCSILVIEHDMPLLSSICDRMIALELGGIIAQGTPAEVLEHPRVIESYLGTNEAAINRSGARTAEQQKQPDSAPAAVVDEPTVEAPAVAAPTRRRSRRRTSTEPGAAPTAES
ncbi:MAG TPA: ATP-binding cassette domain-containing protein [Acidimicrobiales bacterium]|nr:ATP-binding cassette domain-containing protein [Acidimicrobiales bacterium]